MFPCERVGLHFIETAPFRFSNSVDLTITPGQLWQVLEEPESWPRWSFVKKMTWTNPERLGVGSTRTIELRHGTAIDEVIAWKPHSHMAFRIIQDSDSSQRASVEELRIEPTPTGCRLTWTLAHDPKNPSLLAKILAKRAMKWQYTEYLDKLRQYTDQRFGVTI
ncbi:MAG TPA: SRPBCC family protein [Mycobacterium sp.]|nr:SRPBCC family protein [Mycobacterium sp.]